MYIKQQDILDATNGGLDIIIYYYPAAQKALELRDKSFKIRDERTASARIKKLSDGNYVVTDFGGDQTPRNGIQIAMLEEDINFKEAILLLADRYNIASVERVKAKAVFNSRTAKPDEKEGDYFFDVKKEWSDFEYKEIFPNYNKDNKFRYDKVIKRFNIYPLNSFTQIKNRKALITESTTEYPIYLIQHDTFNKIYQPKNPEKQYRFRYTGTRPKNYVNGLIQLRKIYETYKIEQEQSHALEGNDDKSNLKYKKLESVILASGERDALNVAEYGYNVIWLNSETATLTPDVYKELKKYCNDVYLLPDIDTTGILSAMKTNLKYLDIRTIWLPQELLSFKDNRGYPRKDFKDFIELYKSRSAFNRLYNAAIPLKFWDEEIKDKGIKYYFNNEQAYNFLSANGFKKVENKNVKEGYELVRIKGSVVEVIKDNVVKDFLLNFLRKEHYPVSLINMVHKTNQVSNTALSGLAKADIDFTDYTQNSQFLFFENCTWEVTADKVTEHKLQGADKFVWEKEVVKHKVKRLAPAFSTKKRNDGSYLLKVNNTESKFFSYLINGSRIYWREELEKRAEAKYSGDELTKYLKDNKFNIEGDLLDEEEKEEQRQHLLNKCFTIGYLLHRYKEDPRAWCVFAMDNKISEDGESNGRSGKSYCFKFLKQILNTTTLTGRNPKLTDNPHIYDRVTEHTDMILVDDSHQYLNFNFFFGDLTGDMTVNPKNNQSYEIEFEKTPKFVITSNFTMRNLDASTEDRILYTVFSDYYHSMSNNTDYREIRKIYDDFGKTLHKKDYSEKEWNADFNFLADCLQFYLSTPVPKKINPPMSNITLRNLRTIMGDAFKAWADVYFDKDNGMIDEFVPRYVAMEDFEKTTKKRNWTTNKFTKAIKAWAEYTPYVKTLNPKEYTNKEGRITRQYDGKATDMLYVKTKDIAPEKLNDENNIIVENDEKPF